MSSVQGQGTQARHSGGIGKRLLRLFMSGHVSLYRMTGGKIGGGEHLSILTVTGRKSGIKQSVPLFYFRDNDRFVVIASANGAPKHPAWWLNLQSIPEATIQTGSQITTVTATGATGEEYERLWSIIAENYTQFVGYQKKTTREIPVIVLTPLT